MVGRLRGLGHWVLPAISQRCDCGTAVRDVVQMREHPRAQKGEACAKQVGGQPLHWTDDSPASRKRDPNSLDYAAGRWGEAGDFVVIGHFADGTTQTQAVPFGTRELTTLELNWADLESFEINFAGGATDAYGAVDNLVFG